MEKMREYKKHAQAIPDADGDWNYLRANLDSPRRPVTNRLGSGLAAWILGGLRRSQARPASLEVIARLPLGPRQAIALIEAEGTRLLVGTSGDGPVSFFPLLPSPASAWIGPWRGPFSDEPGPDRKKGGTRDLEEATRSDAGIRASRGMRLSGRISW